METSQGSDGSSESEVRQIHIVYFLSRKGVVEQPHLLINLVSTGNDIYLRDVKRWLAELRGKNMPESFAWSCKRKYKYKYGCYVWQDLIDEDLITPFSDNQFVLKGSQISSSTNSISTLQDCTKSEDYLSMQKEELLEENKQERERKKSSEIEEESPKSTLTDDSIKSEEDPKISETGLKDGDESSFSSSSYLSLFNKKPKKTTHSVTMKKTKKSSLSETSSPKSNTRGINNGASKIFRSFINCRNVETKDSVVLPAANRQLKKPSLNNGSDGDAFKNESAEICRIDDKLLGGSQRIYRKKYPWDQPQNSSRKSCDGVTETTTFCGPKTFAAYMPVSCPNCSQCGRKFKPEKLHSHMKSCKGIKASAAKGTKTANPSAKSAGKPALSENTAESTHNQPVPACAY